MCFSECCLLQSFPNTPYFPSRRQHMHTFAKANYNCYWLSSKPGKRIWKERGKRRRGKGSEIAFLVIICYMTTACVILADVWCDSFQAKEKRKKTISCTSVIWFKLLALLVILVSFYCFLIHSQWAFLGILEHRCAP